MIQRAVVDAIVLDNFPIGAAEATMQCPARDLAKSTFVANMWDFNMLVASMWFFPMAFGFFFPYFLFPKSFPNSQAASQLAGSARWSGYDYWKKIILLWFFAVLFYCVRFTVFTVLFSSLFLFSVFFSFSKCFKYREIMEINTLWILTKQDCSTTYAGPNTPKDLQFLGVFVWALKREIFPDFPAVLGCPPGVPVEEFRSLLSLARSVKLGITLETHFGAISADFWE